MVSWMMNTQANNNMEQQAGKISMKASGPVDAGQFLVTGHWQ